MTDSELIRDCMRNERRAQRELYDRFAPVMYAICLRYMHSPDDARDVLQDGFVRVFDRLHTFRQEGSFEGWMKRIFVHLAINQYHKHKIAHEREMAVEVLPDTSHASADIITHLSEKELLMHVASLPPGYRMVFNLYVLEGYRHDEIAELLHIKQATSRSQLLKARHLLQQKLKLQNHEIRERSV